jgi:hypothetical protein
MMTLLLRPSPDRLDFLSSKEMEADNTNFHIQATARMRFVYFLLPRAKLGSQKGEPRTSSFIYEGVWGDDYLGGSELCGISIPVYPYTRSVRASPIRSAARSCEGRLNLKCTSGKSAGLHRHSLNALALAPRGFCSRAG